MTEAESRIAVIDDDASVRKALSRLLSAFGYHVQTYASAREFLNAFERGRPACLIVDQQMEEMTGLELQHGLNDGGKKIPVIILTAHNEPGMRRRCIDAGAVAFLIKPAPKDELLGAIKAALGAHKAS